VVRLFCLSFSPRTKPKLAVSQLAFMACPAFGEPTTLVRDLGSLAAYSTATRDRRPQHQRPQQERTFQRDS